MIYTVRIIARISQMGATDRAFFRVGSMDLNVPNLQSLVLSLGNHIPAMLRTCVAGIAYMGRSMICMVDPCVRICNGSHEVDFHKI